MSFESYIETIEKLRAELAETKAALEAETLAHSFTQAAEKGLAKDLVASRAETAGTMEQLRLQERTTTKESEKLAAATALLKRWMDDEDHSEDGSVRSETGVFLKGKP